MSSNALQVFVKSIMGDIYGEQCCTYNNVHLLLHLTPSVRYLGPLWAMSMFKFEGYNMTILNSYDGSNSVGLQIAKHLSQRRAVSIIHTRVKKEKPYSPALDIYSK